MRELFRRCRPHLLVTFALLVCGLGLTGCTLMDRAGEILYPTETPSQSLPTIEQPPTSEPVVEAPPTDAPSSAATGAPTQTYVPPKEPPPTPALAPTPQNGQSMLYAQGGTIYRGDRLGGDAVEVALVPQLESWDLAQGSLATAHGRAVDMIDLQEGKLTSLSVDHEGPFEYAQVLWGVSRDALLYAGIVEDPKAETFQRSVVLRAYAGYDGSQLGGAVVSDVTGVLLLRYDDDEARVTLIPQKGAAALKQVDVYDLRSGEIVQSLSISGEGQAAASADGRFLLTMASQGDSGPRQLRFYALKDATGAPAVWDHPDNTQSDSHIWSPDGRYVAMLMRDGETSDETTVGLGLWVLDLASLEAREILKDDSLSSSLVAWTPDGELILGHHRGEDGSYHYVLRPDGGGRQILPLGEDVEILGWMPTKDASVPPKVVVDPWRARILDAEGHPEAIAQIVAELVASQVQSSPENLTAQIQAYLADAGWDASQGQIRVVRLDDETFVAQLPVRAIYLLESGRASTLARGEVLIDARLVEDELGLVFGNDSRGALQPTYILFQRPTESGSGQAWRVVWAPMGHRDWIATDGEIRFVGEGLGRLEVRGSTFGLDLGESQVFVECRDCPHRWLVGTWVRDASGYARQSELPDDSPLAELYWEMTEPEPYAILYEFLRRARAGLDVTTLASDPAFGQAEALGLFDFELALRPEEETTEGVRFSELEGKRAFIAQVEGNRVAQIETLEP